MSASLVSSGSSGSRTGLPPSAPAARPLFLPREHGAYALVIAPLVTAFCRGVPSWTGAAFALATLALFIAHEPVLVLLAQRGARTQRTLGAQARRAFGIRVGIALVAGGYGLYSADVATRLSLVPVAVLGVGLVVLALRASEKSGPGTLLLALSSAAAGVPVALANAWSLRDAALTGVVFAVAGMVSMFTVRELIPKRRHQGGLAAYVAWLTALVALVFVAAGALRAEVPAYFAWAFVPTLTVALVVLRLRPHPRHLRAVGWSLAAAKVATFAVLAFAPAQTALG